MTLIVFKEDENQDFVRSGKSFATLSGAEAAAQELGNIMRVQLGEYRYDQTKGIDYIGKIFPGINSLQYFEGRARKQILAKDYVQKIVSFDYSLSNGELSYTMEIKTDYGTVSVAS